MMFMSRHGGGRVLRVFALASAIALAAGGVALAVRAEAAPVAGQLWATLSLMRESDDYVRALVAKQFIVAAGLAMALATAWGFGESYAGAYHVPAWMIYPLFWACFGLIAPFMRGSSR